MRTGVGLWVRAELRARWRALLVLVVLCAVVVAVVLASVAGARRTTTAYDRYLAEVHASHADVQLIAGLSGRSDVDLGNGATADEVIAGLRDMPEVLLFGGVAATAGLVAIATAVTRQLESAGADGLVLSALGLTRGRPSGRDPPRRVRRHAVHVAGLQSSSRSSKQTVTVSPASFEMALRTWALIGSLCVPSPRAMNELRKGWPSTVPLTFTRPRVPKSLSRVRHDHEGPPALVRALLQRCQEPFAQPGHRTTSRSTPLDTTNDGGENHRAAAPGGLVNDPVGHQITVAHTSQVDGPTLESARSLLEVVFDGDFTDDDWEHALGGLHALARHDGQLVGHASVIQRRLLYQGRALRAGYVEGVGVRPDLQRRGIGSGLMRAIEEVIAAAYDIGALGASDEALAFYEHRAWTRWRGPTSALTPDGIRRTSEEDGFVFVLDPSGTMDVSAKLSCDWRDGDVW